MNLLLQQLDKQFVNVATSKELKSDVELLYSKTVETVNKLNKNDHINGENTDKITKPGLSSKLITSLDILLSNNSSSEKGEWVEQLY